VSDGGAGDIVYKLKTATDKLSNFVFWGHSTFFKNTNILDFQQPTCE